MKTKLESKWVKHKGKINIKRNEVFFIEHIILLRLRFGNANWEGGM